MYYTASSQKISLQKSINLLIEILRSPIDIYISLPLCIYHETIKEGTLELYLFT